MNKNRQLQLNSECICCWQWVLDSHLEYGLHVEWTSRVVWNLWYCSARGVLRGITQGGLASGCLGRRHVARM